MRQPLLSFLLLTIPTVLFVGCTKPPSMLDLPEGMPLTENWKQPESLAVVRPEEKSAVIKMETSRATYKFRCEVLAAFYHRIGNVDKERWATNERDNVTEARMWQWENVPKVFPPDRESLEGADERLLVEYLVTARNQYIADTHALRTILNNNGDSYKARCVDIMIARLDPIKLYPYFPESMLPPRSLRPTQQITEADNLFREAYDLYWNGKGVFHTFLTTSYPKERLACVKFLRLIRDYPQSTKIALAAYYIGEINKEYFRENALAVYWYERAWTWDPHVTEPARFQAATVYDLHLRNYAKAVECYRLSLKYDPYRLLNPEHCRQRIEDLTGQKQ